MAYPNRVDRRHLATTTLLPSGSRVGIQEYALGIKQSLKLVARVEDALETAFADFQLFGAFGQARIRLG